MTHLLYRTNAPYWAVKHDSGSSWEPSTAIISVHPLQTPEQAQYFLQNSPGTYRIMPIRWYDRWMPECVWRKRLNVDMVVWVHDD